MIIGSYFGEIEIIFKVKRQNTTIAAEDTELLTISKQFYESIIILEYTEIHEEIKYLALIRSEKNVEAEKFLNQTLNANRERNSIMANLNKFNVKKQCLRDQIVELRRIKKELETTHELERAYKSFEYNDVEHKIEGWFRQLLNNDFSHSFPIMQKNSAQIFSSRNNLIEVSEYNDSSSNPKNVIFDSPIKSKNQFYTKLIEGNKQSGESRRPSLVFREIMRNKISNLKTDTIEERDNEASSISSKLSGNLGDDHLNISPSRSSFPIGKKRLNILHKIEGLT